MNRNEVSILPTKWSNIYTNTVMSYIYILKPRATTTKTKHRDTWKTPKKNQWDLKKQRNKQIGRQEKKNIVTVTTKNW